MNVRYYSFFPLELAISTPVFGPADRKERYTHARCIPAHPQDKISCLRKTFWGEEALQTNTAQQHRVWRNRGSNIPFQFSPGNAYSTPTLFLAHFFGKKEIEIFPKRKVFWFGSRTVKCKKISTIVWYLWGTSIFVFLFLRILAKAEDRLTM